jgi:hypothetical protein
MNQKKVNPVFFILGKEGEKIEQKGILTHRAAYRSRHFSYRAFGYCYDASDLDP